MAHPLGVKGFAYRRVKNDERDAADLADLLRMGRLPQAWIVPPDTRELRELVRHRAKLVALRSGLKCGVYAVLAKNGVHVAMSDLFGAAGTRLLDALELPAAYQARVVSLQRIIDAIDLPDRLLCQDAVGPAGQSPWLAGDPGHLRRSARSWQQYWSPKSVTSPACSALSSYAPGPA